jgi:hypothetical protein
MPRHPRPLRVAQWSKRSRPCARMSRRHLASCCARRQPTSSGQPPRSPTSCSSRRRWTLTQPLWLADLSGVQTAPLGTPVPAPLQSFNGLSLNGSLPPDTNADVSDTHVIQWVNTQWNVFNKTTGLPIGSPMEGNIFWAGFGGVCETNDAGDPIVLYDDAAERWVFSQFTGSTTPRQCFAISQTSDPMGPVPPLRVCVPAVQRLPAHRYLAGRIDGS